MRFSLLQERSALFNCPRSAPIAQLVEQLICNQWVGSSSLSGGTIVFKGLAETRWAFCFSGETLGKHYFNYIRVLSMQELRVR
jgi:hypothetical protein